MKRTLIIFLIIIFNINISYAKNDSNITIEELNYFLASLGLGPYHNEKIWDKDEGIGWQRYRLFINDNDSYYINLNNYERLEIEESYIEYFIKYISSRGVEPIPRNLCVKYKKNQSEMGTGFNCDFKKKNYLSSKDYLELLKDQSGGYYPRPEDSIEINKSIWASNNDVFSLAFSNKYYLDTSLEKLEEERKAKKRRSAKCLTFVGTKKSSLSFEQCYHKVVRGKFSMSKKSKKKFPGDIFYAFVALDNLIYKSNRSFAERSKKNTKDSYIVLKKKYEKPIDKFRKDPSNEEVLGKKLISAIKSFRSIKLMRASVGVHTSTMHPYPDVMTRYFAMGDMLNSRVGKVKKNKKNPDVKKREVLLKKYSNSLLSIKKRLEQNNYKSLDENVLTLSTAFKNLNQLPNSTSEFGKNFDLAIDSISDSNKLIEISTLNAQKNDDEKLLALSSIKVMENMINSISNNLPDEYQIIPVKLENNLSAIDNQNIEQIIQDINIVRGDELVELTKSMDVIDKSFNSKNSYTYKYSLKSINSSNVMKTLNNLGMKNTIDRSTLSALNKRLSTPDTATEAAAKQLKDSLDREWAKEVFNNMSVYENVSNVADQAVQNAMNETSVNDIDTSTPEGAKEWGEKVFGNMSID